MPADLQPMAVAPRAPGDYAAAAGVRAIEALAHAAAQIGGTRVLHVSVAGAEGRVPELLGGLLPLAAGAGVHVEWRVLFGPPELPATATALMSGLRGGESDLGGRWAAFLDACAQTARSLSDGFDAVVLDDAAVGLAAGLGDRESGPAVVWRIHEDVSSAEEDALARAAELANVCASVLVPHDSFAPPGIEATAAAPGIDPLDPRNLELEARLPGRVVRPLGIDLDRAFVLQVLELDRWDDPQAAIDAFRIAKAEDPELQLVLAAVLDRAVTESWQAAKEITDYARGAGDVHLLTSYEGLGSLELGALLLLARAVIERSLREGFELTPFEALWRRTPVVGGLPIQVRDGVDGYLAPRAEDAAARIVELVRDPGLAVELGRAGRERVRERFLVTAALERELRALADSLEAR